MHSYDHLGNNNLYRYIIAADQFNGNNAQDSVVELCHDKYEGRQSGTKEGLQSAQWIASKFKEYGLEPYSENSYLQAFDIPFIDYIHPTSFSIDNQDMTYRNDFIVFPGSGSSQIKTTGVFVGMGISNSEMNYDDYKDIDVKDKIVVILDDLLLPEYSPKGYDSYEFQYQIDNALKHGAKGIIFVSQAGSYANIFMNIMETRFTYALVNAPSDIPVLYIREDVFDTYLSPSISLLEICLKIDESRKPASFDLSIELEITSTAESATKTAYNVVGYIPSSIKTTTKSIVIGASYDHLGKDKISGEIFYGANDNASGVSVLLEVARVLSQSDAVSKYHIVFIAFAAGKAKALGANHYVEHPIFPTDQIEMMINLQQVGSKLLPSWYTITNTYTLSYAHFALLEHTCKKYFSYKYKIMDTDRDFNSPYRFGFDADPFYQREVPFVSFHNNDGAYQFLHLRKVSDTPEVVNPWILQEIGHAVAGYLSQCGEE